MTVIRAQVSIPSDTTVPEDACLNVWHFHGAGAQTPLDVATSAHAKLTTFYQAIDGDLSINMASPATVKCYDLEDAQPRVPIFTAGITLTLSAGTGAPNELAVCLSYYATPVSGQSQARRRGRIYIGPIGTGMFSPSGGRVEVSSAFRTTLGAAATALAGGSDVTEAVWSVFSPTTAGPEPWSPSAIASATNHVDAGWVDNAFDIQRRRGTAATARTTWVA